ncbi:MAG: transposase [Cyanobacteria bacterium P01_D01_bin.116]
MAAQSAQQTLKVLQRDINSYNSLVTRFFEGEVNRPRIPRYRKSGGLFTVIFPVQALTFRDGFAYPSVSKLSKRDLLCEIKLEVPQFVDINLVREIRIRPSRGEFWIDWICDDAKQEVSVNPNLDYSHALAIDHGVKFWLSAVNTKGKSFIVEAPQLKTAIWKYQQKVKQYKEGKSNFYWDEYLDKLTAKYNLQVRDSVNKAARFIINHCLLQGIGNLVIGWNKSNKQNINLGRKNNYEVVSMPTARLIKRLEELSKEYGIKFIVTTEEYTSKASFIDNDELHQYGEKPCIVEAVR